MLHHCSHVSISRVQQLFNLPSNETTLCSLHQSPGFRRHNVKAGVCGAWAIQIVQYQPLHLYPLLLQWHLTGSAAAAVFGSLGDTGRISSIESKTISSFQPVRQRDSQTTKPSNTVSKHQGALFSKDSQRGSSVWKIQLCSITPRVPSKPAITGTEGVAKEQQNFFFQFWHLCQIPHSMAITISVYHWSV